MPAGMRAELKGVSAEIADIVGAHMMKAAELIDEDPELAYRHAEAARRRAPRLPLTREATAETAYAAGFYDQALAQYRTLKRMTGNSDLIPVIVDCLRALGKHREALEMATQDRSQITNPSMVIELVIVVAGVRRDMGQVDEALRILRQEIEHPSVRHPRQAQARLLYAYGDMLAGQDKSGEAYHWFSLSASLDPEATSAIDRMDEYDGMTLELDEAEFHEEEADGDQEGEKPDGDEPESDESEVDEYLDDSLPDGALEDDERPDSLDELDTEEDEDSAEN
ncbi:MAG: hypothetical protein FWG15_04410 [Propionibacteriaceae bacterium]|nr:hypothetical protein [Propionibacteriaceae bacterium]